MQVILKKINEAKAGKGAAPVFVPEHFRTAFEKINVELPKEREVRKVHLADNPGFNLGVGFGILLNTLILGIDVDSQRGSSIESRLPFFALDCVFFLAFFVEMMIRVDQLKWEYFGDPWNFFDFNVVLLTFADIIVSVTEGASGSLKVASAIRIVRLLRIVRNIKGLKIFYGLWLVLQGLIESMRTIFWVALMLVIIVYVLAIAITTLVGQSDFVQEHWDDAYIYVGTVARSMWTVFQLITFDNWGQDIARPMIRVSPGAAAFLFVSVILCSFGVLNVVVAVMVEKALSLSKESKDAQKSAVEKTERQLYASMHSDFRSASSNPETLEVDQDEFKTMVTSDDMSYKLRLLGIHSDEADELFDILDDDGSGTVSPEEFLNGLQKLKGNAQGPGLVTLISFAQRQRTFAARYVTRIKKLNEKADEIQERLIQVGREMGKEIRDRKICDSHRDKVWRQAEEREVLLEKLDKARQFSYPGLVVKV